MVFFLSSVAVDVGLHYSKTGSISVLARKQERRKYLGEWSSWMAAKRPLGQKPRYRICLDVMGTRPQVSQQQGKCTSWWSLASIAVMLLHTAHPSELVVTNKGKLLGTSAPTELPKAVLAMRWAAAAPTADSQWPCALLKWHLEQYFMLL